MKDMKAIREALIRERLSLDNYSDPYNMGFWDGLAWAQSLVEEINAATIDCYELMLGIGGEEEV